MKVFTTLQLAGGVAAWTLPHWHIFGPVPSHLDDEDPAAWLDMRAIVAEAKQKTELAIKSGEAEIIPELFSGDDSLEALGDLGSDFFVDDADSELSEADLAAVHPPHKHNVTIYEFLKMAKFATNFTALLDKDKDLVKALNSTKTNSTVFVPIDKAFRHIPHKGGKKPPKEFISKLLRYHIAGDALFGKDLFPKHTIPTMLDEEMLGGEPQRLRVRIGLFGSNINFYSRIVVANAATTNGVVHFVSHILVPPPFAGRELTLFPGTFSTLLLAYEKTDFVDKVVHRMKTTGGTVLAPSNMAFRRLGPAANAFLFNSPTGLKCLEALLKYQIVPNVTLYSDAKYEAPPDDDDEDDKKTVPSHGADEMTEMGKLIKMEHFRLPTLLKKPVWVTIKKFHGLIVGMSVNRHVGIKVQDGIAKNAVVHVMDKVPIPPHRHGHKDAEDDGDEISVEELQERLAPYIDWNDEDDFSGGEL